MPASNKNNETQSARRVWKVPQVRRLAAGAAENGPNFPTADGIEGQS